MKLCHKAGALENAISQCSRHYVSITVFQTLSGQMLRISNRLGHYHRYAEVQLHRMSLFLRDMHNPLHLAFEKTFAACCHQMMNASTAI